ncbi:MAG: LysR family transcriptional regulator [Lachnospiraceae bacterium]|nr:LysR family transcriptional regulator [Lachnospiraceae bacterium]
MTSQIHANISVRIFTDAKCFGPGLAELLTRVDEYSSLRKAAQSMKMAYSKAWTILHNSEEALGFRLLDMKTGGRGGGGAVLTEEGRRMLTAYRSYCEKLKTYSDSIFEEEFSFLS